MLYCARLCVSKRRKLPPLIPEQIRVPIPCTTLSMDNSWQHSAEQFDSSVKYDDADTNLALSDRHILCVYDSASPAHLETLRSFLIRVAIRRLNLKFIRYLRRIFSSTYVQWLTQRDPLRNVHGRKAAQDTVTLLHDIIQSGTAATLSTYSKWETGLSLFFWRWYPD